MLNHTNLTTLTCWELESPWPDQWQSEEQENHIAAQRGSGLDPEGTELRDDPPDWEETINTNDTPDVIPWGLMGEPHWISELDNASEPEPEEDPFLLRMQHLGYELKLEEELFPHQSNDNLDWKETLSLQPQSEHKPQIKDQRSLTNKASSSASDDKKGTMKINNQTWKDPKSEDKEGTTNPK